MTSSAPQAHAPRFWSRDYFLLWQGQVVSQIGDAFYTIAVFWFVYQKTNSPLATGLVMTFSVLPFVLLGALAGQRIDRWNKKHILIGTDLVRGIIVLGVTFLAWTGQLEVHLLYGAVFLTSCCSVFFNPTVTASIPCLVAPAHLIRANSLGEASRNLASVISPMVGGVLIAVLGVEVAFLINAVSYLASAVSELLISPVRLAPTDAQKKLMLSVRETLAKLKAKAALFRLICTSLIVNFFGMAVVLLPIFATGHLGGSSVDFGILSSCYGAGALASVLGLAAWGAKINKARAIVVLLAVFGLGFLVLAWRLEMYTAAPVMFLLGLCAATTRMSYLTIMQENIDPAMHGRAFGIILSADTALQPLTYVVTGALVQMVSLSATLLAFGLAILVGAGYLFSLKGFRELAHPTPAKAEQ